MDFITRMKLMGGVPVDLSKLHIKESVETVVTKAIDYLDKEANKQKIRSQKALYMSDAADYEKVLQAIKDGDKKAAQKAYGDMDTAARDVVFELVKDKKMRKELADYLGVDLLRESSEDNKESESEMVNCPICKQECSKDDFYSHMTSEHDDLESKEEPADDGEKKEEEQESVTLELTSESEDKAVGDWVSRIKNDEADMSEVPEELRDAVRAAMADSKTDDSVMEAKKEAKKQPKKEAKKSTGGAENATVWDHVTDADESPDPKKDEAKLAVPKEMISDLTREIKELRAEAESLATQRKQKAEFFIHVADAMEHVKKCLEKGTDLGFKEAQVFTQSLMSPMQVRFPDSVMKYLATSGKPTTLKGLFQAVKDKK